MVWYGKTYHNITFSIEDDLINHIQRRHTQTDPDIPSQSTHNHVHAMILEEQIDMAQTLNQFKESMNAQLNEIKNNQEVLKDTIKQLTDENSFFRSNTNSLFQSLQSNLENQISGLVSSIRSNISPSTNSRPSPAPAPVSVSFCLLF